MGKIPLNLKLGTYGSIPVDTRSGDSADLGNSEKKESESKTGLGAAAGNCKGKGKLPAEPEDDWLETCGVGACRVLFRF